MLKVENLKTFKMRKTIIERLDNDWRYILNACRNTVNKGNSKKDVVSNHFKQSIMIAEHSPIRDWRVAWKWEGIPSWVSVHFCRHWLGFLHFVSTQRTDRTGVDRNKKPQDTPVNMKCEANAQALINIGKVRLCYKAAPETRQYMEDVKATLYDINEGEVANVIVPSCIYRCGCPEMGSCGYWKKFCEEHSDIDFTDIRSRYKAYNDDFKKSHSIESNL